MTSPIIHFSDQEKAIVFKKRIARKKIIQLLADLNPFYDKNFIRRKY